MCAARIRKRGRKPSGLRDSVGASVEAGRTPAVAGARPNVMKSKLIVFGMAVVMGLAVAWPAAGQDRSRAARCSRQPRSGRAEGARRRDAGHAGDQGKEHEQEGEQEAERRGLGISLGRPSVAPPGPRYARRFPAAAAGRSAGLGRVAARRRRRPLGSRCRPASHRHRRRDPQPLRLPGRARDWRTTGIPGATST